MRRRSLHPKSWLPLLAGLAWLAAAAPAPAQESPAARAPGPGAPTAAEAAGAPAPAAPSPPEAPPPGLGEASRAAVASVLDAARRDGAHWARRTHDWKDSLLAGAGLAWRDLVADPAGSIDAWLTEAGLPSSEVLLVPGLALAGALALVLAWLAGRGALVVSIQYPTELDGTFSVRLARKPSAGSKPRTASPAAAERARRRAGASRRTERHLVARETEFGRIPTGRWFVSVDGFLQPASGEAVIGTHFDEREIRVRRGGTVRIDFDFRPQQCPIDVKVLWDKRLVPDALVAWRGLPHSLRYARGATVRLGAPQGQPVLVVGSRDRVAELPLEVNSFQPKSIELDLADREKLLFTGCPPAVEAYLHGDIPGAARALEREGQQQVAQLVRARLAEEQGYEESAARYYAEAGCPLEAAEIHARLSQFERSGELFESAGELVRAAEMYRTAGELTKAGEAYERAREFETAVDCFREVGDVTRWCEALEKDGRAFAAAQVALEHGDDGRAIRSLQRVTPDEPDYVEAANLLVDVLQREGHLDLAVEKVEEVIRHRGADRVPLETCDQLARLLEENGQLERALDVLEIVRRRDAAYPDLAARIEGLRKRRAEERERRETRPRAAASAFSEGFRYEILEEIGRGGMGIVFKARDRRLGRVVALKRLPDNLRNHPKAVELFLREARASAALNHPNIVTVHDAGQEGDTFYITMELLEGYPLNQILRSRGHFGARDVARLGQQACAGLQYAHDKRIVHRDVKTANFFFTTARSLKIMDFGLAKMLEEVRRASTVIGGTPYYMAPEQSEGSAVDHRADLYALGVTFFELLTGKVPFPEGDVTFHHRHSPAPDPRAHGENIPDELAELVLALMAKAPEARPESAAAVRERLQRIADALRRG